MSIASWTARLRSASSPSASQKSTWSSKGVQDLLLHIGKADDGRFAEPQISHEASLQLRSLVSLAPVKPVRSQFTRRTGCLDRAHKPHVASLTERMRLRISARRGAYSGQGGERQMLDSPPLTSLSGGTYPRGGVAPLGTWLRNASDPQGNARARSEGIGGVRGRHDAL